jgi:hypothetical protein
MRQFSGLSSRHSRMRLALALTLLVSSVASTNDLGTQKSQDGACQALQRTISVLRSLPLTGPPGLGWFCDFSTLTTYQFYVIALRSNRPAPDSNLMGWYAVFRSDYAVYEYDIERLAPSKRVDLPATLAPLPERGRALLIGAYRRLFGTMYGQMVWVQVTFLMLDGAPSPSGSKLSLTPGHHSLEFSCEVTLPEAVNSVEARLRGSRDIDVEAEVAYDVVGELNQSDRYCDVGLVKHS